jgi:hypothetical protein
MPQKRDAGTFRIFILEDGTLTWSRLFQLTPRKRRLHVVTAGQSICAKPLLHEFTALKGTPHTQQLTPWYVIGKCYCGGFVGTYTLEHI